MLAVLTLLLGLAQAQERPEIALDPGLSLRAPLLEPTPETETETAPPLRPSGLEPLELQRLRTARHMRNAGAALLVLGPAVTAGGLFLAIDGFYSERPRVEQLGIVGMAAGGLATVISLPFVFASGSMAREVAWRAHGVAVPATLGYVSGGLIVGSVVTVLAMGPNQDWLYVLPVAAFGVGVAGAFIWAGQCVNAASYPPSVSIAPARLPTPDGRGAWGVVVQGRF